MLLDAPFDLFWGDSIYADVYASNVYGDGLSSQGNGAIILTNPDEPLNLQKNTPLMTPTVIGL